MSLSTELIRIHSLFVGETRQVLAFIRMSEAALEHQKANIKISGFDKKDAAEMEKLISFLVNFDNGKLKSGSTTLNSKKLGELVLSLIVPIKHTTILAEMSLSYLISFEEAFLKDYIRTILLSRRALLRSKKKQLSYEVICEHGSMTSLIKSLVLCP
jgi:hypothetical protein